MWNSHDETSPPGSVPSSSDAELERYAFAARTVRITGTIDEALAVETVRRMIALDHASHEPIRVLISSPCGHVESGDAIHNVVRFIAAPVTMIGNGCVGSAATHVYLAAPLTRRFCLPHARLLIHQPSGGIAGKGTDTENQVRELLRVRERIAGVIARETGRSLNTVLNDIDRDRRMSAEAAVDYGLVSRVIEQAADLHDRN